MQVQSCRFNHAGSDIEEVFKNLTKQTNVAGEDGLQFFLKDYDTDEKLAPPVSDEMAIWKNKLPADKLKPRLDKVSRPSNLNIQVKKCNEEIWALQNGQVGRIRSSDIKMQSIQMALSKAIIPIIRLADDCVKAKDDKSHTIDAKTALEACMDSIVLLENSNSQVDYFRRDQFKSILQDHLRPIVTHPTDATTLLFGENLDEQIKQITEKSKIKNSVSAGKKFSPQSRPRITSDKGPNYSSKSQNRFSKNYHSFPRTRNTPLRGSNKRKGSGNPAGNVKCAGKFYRLLKRFKFNKNTQYTHFTFRCVKLQSRKYIICLRCMDTNYIRSLGTRDSPFMSKIRFYGYSCL